MICKRLSVTVAAAVARAQRVLCCSAQILPPYGSVWLTALVPLTPIIASLEADSALLAAEMGISLIVIFALLALYATLPSYLHLFHSRRQFLPGCLHQTCVYCINHTRPRYGPA